MASANDGITALIEVGRIEPDLLILDIEIPGVDGIEVRRRINGRCEQNDDYRDEW